MPTLRHLTWLLSISLVLIGAMMALAPASHAEAERYGRVTGEALPRWVSLKNEDAYMRRGPTKNHAIEWVYQRQFMPIEVVGEFGNWRKVRDRDGTLGWMGTSVLHNHRTGMIQKDRTPLFRMGTQDSDVIAILEEDVIVHLKACQDHWCHVQVDNLNGWLPMPVIYGVYGHELIN
ncbi:MAG: aspartyl-trna synthetase [Kiloniella sp.]|nr:aspartyl-trna synthetase [Kiloniella sp.]RZO29473.1 MAG: aspartyl-trna synthetase [Rhodospirillaceae bacterium]